jgi:hypothetical protein
MPFTVCLLTPHPDGGDFETMAVMPAVPRVRDRVTYDHVDGAPTYVVDGVEWSNHSEAPPGVRQWIPMVTLVPETT